MKNVVPRGGPSRSPGGSSTPARGGPDDGSGTNDVAVTLYPPDGGRAPLRQGAARGGTVRRRRSGVPRPADPARTTCSWRLPSGAARRGRRGRCVSSDVPRPTAQGRLDPRGAGAGRLAVPRRPEHGSPGAGRGEPTPAPRGPRRLPSHDIRNARPVVARSVRGAARGTGSPAGQVPPAPRPVLLAGAQPRRGGAATRLVHRRRQGAPGARTSHVADSAGAARLRAVGGSAGGLGELPGGGIGPAAATDRCHDEGGHGFGIRRGVRRRPRRGRAPDDVVLEDQGDDGAPACRNSGGRRRPRGTADRRRRRAAVTGRGEAGGRRRQDARGGVARHQRPRRRSRGKARGRSQGLRPRPALLRGRRHAPRARPRDERGGRALSLHRLPAEGGRGPRESATRSSPSRRAISLTS